MATPVTIVGVAVLFAAVASGFAYGQGIASWRLVPDLRIGEVEDSRFILETVRYLVVGPDDRVYAADPQAGTVFVFARDGSFVRPLGRRGQGPGEFQTISGIGLLGDTLWAADRLRSQITLFTAAGEVARTRPLPPELSAGIERPSRAAGVLADGSFLALAEPSPYEPGGTVMQAVPLRRYAQASGRPDTLLILHRSPTSVRVTSQGQSRLLPLPIPRNNDRWGIAPDGSFVVAVRASAEESTGTISAYTVEAVAASGDLIFRRRYEHDPILVSDERRDDAFASFAGMLMRAEGGTRFAALRRAREMLPVPETQLAVNWVVVGSDGRIWLHRLDQPGFFTALDGRTGDVLGQAAFPDQAYPGVGVDAADDRFIWMVERDNLDIPYIVRYRIIAGG